MKLEARHVRFRASLPWFTRHRMLFVGKRNTLQLLETALVIEGYLMRLFFPLVDAFFRRPLSEWSTITVPYSRILRFKHAPMIIPRVIVTVRALASMLFSTSSAIAFSGLLWDNAMMVIAFQSSPIFSRPRA